jgi:DNA polymerase-3 subunit epsilon
MPPHHSAPDSSAVRRDCVQPRRDAEEAQAEAAIGLTTASEVSSERRVISTVSESLSQLEVLVVDCQATAAAPHGHLLEMGWARAGTTTTRADARLIALPDGEHIPAAVMRLTGISELMAQDGVDAQVAWRELSNEAATLARQPAPTVIHFARFEKPFLCALAGDEPPLDILCTHDIARRLLPGLPRCGVRALTGYFGRGIGALRRSADHVEATAFVWRQLVRLLRDEGISTWSVLQEWLANNRATKQRRRLWPMPRDVRLSLPDTPGVYRMLRTSGDVLYVGKAASLRHRVNSYFRKQTGVPERTLEMLSQARGISFDVTPSALEAALIEADEIKQHRPPYNVALTIENRALWFAPPNLTARSAHPSAQCPLGPFPSVGMLDEFGALAAAESRALGSSRWRPDPVTFEAGFARLCVVHPELSRHDLGAHDRLLRLGTRLWREGRRDRDVDEDDPNEAVRGLMVWTPEFVQVSLEWLALRAALARRRAIWLTRLVDSSVVWREPGDSCARLIVIENSEVVFSGATDANATPPIPPGHRRPVAARREAFTLASFDRLRVLTTELKRLTAAGAPVALRLGVAPALDDSRLASALWWM